MNVMNIKNDVDFILPRNPREIRWAEWLHSAQTDQIGQESGTNVPGHPHAIHQVSVDEIIIPLAADALGPGNIGQSDAWTVLAAVIDADKSHGIRRMRT